MSLHASVKSTDKLTDDVEYADSKKFRDYDWNDTWLLNVLTEDLVKKIFQTSPKDEFDILKNPAVSSLVIMTYAVVIVLGASGSLLVLVTVLKTRQMWNATNIFIANLAVADVFVCTFDLPLALYYELTDDWVFGRMLCRIIPTAFATTIYSSTLTLTLIALDRYLLIVCPTKLKISIKSALLLVLVITVTAIGAPLPIAVYAEYIEVHDRQLSISRRYCTERWPNEISRKMFTVITLLLQLIIPLFINAVLYFLIFSRLRRRVKTSSTHKGRTNKMLVSVVVVFALTWTPYHLFSVASEFWPEQVTGRFFKLADVLLKVVSMSSSCINPFLYGWMNEKYRAAFAVMIKMRRLTGSNRTPVDRAGQAKPDRKQPGDTDQARQNKLQMNSRAVPDPTPL